MLSTPVFGTLWFYIGIGLLFTATFVKTLGVTTPKNALTVSSLSVGASLLAGSLVSVIVMKYALSISNPAFWSSIGKIGLYVGVDNIPYILTFFILAIITDFVSTPLRSKFIVVGRVGYGSAHPVSQPGLTFGVPTTTNQIIILDNIGKQAIKNYKEMTKKKNVKPVKGKKLDIKTLKSDIPSVIRSAGGGGRTRTVPNVWDERNIADLREVVLKETRTPVSTEETPIEKKMKRDEIDEIIEGEQREIMRVIDDPNEVVMIAYTSLMKTLMTNFNIPPEEAGQEDRYQMLSRRKKGDIWEFIIRYHIDPFTAYDFAVYVDKFGRSEVVLVNVS